jgi:glycosyltransferase involved in cell wall biosynthesis
MNDIIPTVSVIIPTFNRAPLLKRSIGSILNQTFQDFEIIVVDDASTDNTEEIIHNLEDKRIRYIKHETNRGGSAARNTGIKAARSKLIAFQDSDDEWLPEKLEKQMKVLASSPPHLGVVYTGFWRIRGDNKEYIPGPAIPVKEGNIHQELLRGNFVTTQAVVVKKECFQQAGMFDETLPRLQDWELFLRISKCFEFRYIPEPLVRSFFTDDSISSKPKALIKAVEIILEKHFAEYKADPTIYAGQLIGLANLYRQEDDIRKSRDYLVKTIKNHFRPGLIVALCASFLGLNFYNLYWEWITRVQGNRNNQ